MAATRSLTSKKKKPGQAFYETSGVRTSAQIIEEARRSVRGALPTNRPFTPAESGRVLFGSKHSVSRPPSVYSIGAHHFLDERLSRPNTGQRLVPIEQSALEDKSFKVTLLKHVYTCILYVHVYIIYCSIKVLFNILFDLYRCHLEQRSTQLPLLLCSHFMTCQQSLCPTAQQNIL